MPVINYQEPAGGWKPAIGRAGNILGSTAKSIADQDWSKLIPLIQGGLSVGSEIYQNREARAEAERNRQFQERMSSTAIQRSVADYRAAGLNPALAYDRSASSPGGAQAIIGNVGGKAVSSALDAKRAMQDMEMQRQQNEATLKLITAQTGKAVADTGTSDATTRLLQEQAGSTRQQAQFTAINQPFTTRQAAAEALLKELQVPDAQNQAAVADLIKRYPALRNAKTAAEIIGILGNTYFNRR